MKHLKQFNEKFHVNQDVKHLTTIIYNKIYQLLPKLILNKQLEINNCLSSYSRIVFNSDEIILKLGSKNYGVLKSIDLVDGRINTVLEFTIKLSSIELGQKKLINNKIREDINHELQHIIEYYHSDGKLSKSWGFHKRLKEHENRFKDNKDWLEVCYLFYLAEEHELRAKVSQSLELLKNDDDLYKSDLYKKVDILTKLDYNSILKKIYNSEDFGIIIVDFVKNVLLRKGDYIKIFKSYILDINKIAKVYKKKMLRVLYFHKNPNIFEINIEKEINYADYIVDERVEKRDKLIEELEKNFKIITNEIKEI